MFYSISRKPTLRIAKIEGIAYIMSGCKLKVKENNVWEKCRCTVPKNKTENFLFSKLGVFFWCAVFLTKYSADLISEHLNNRLLHAHYSNGLLFRRPVWIVGWYSNFGLNNGPLTKWWSEYQTAMLPASEERTIWRSNKSPTQLVRSSGSHCNWNWY